jgi:hypothetical protein
MQEARAELPLGELELVGQNRHDPIDAAPSNVVYVPEKQSLHATEPVMSLYFPATQNMHGPPSGPVKPLLQVQAVMLELVEGELERVGHEVQRPVPVVVL